MMRSDRRASLVAQTVKNLPAMGSDPWVRKIPWRREWQLTAVFLPGKSHGQRSVVGYSPWGRKEWARVGDCSFHFQEGNHHNSSDASVAVMACQELF